MADTIQSAGSPGNPNGDRSYLKSDGTLVREVIPGSLDGSGIVQPVSSSNPIPVTLQSDIGAVTSTLGVSAVVTGTLTAADVTGAPHDTPTAGSFVQATAIANYPTAAFTLSGTYAGVTVTCEGYDGTHWYTLPSMTSIGAFAGAFVLPANGSVTVETSFDGFTAVRIRCTAYTSGTVNVSILPIASSSDPVVGMMATQGPQTTGTITASGQTVVATGLSSFNYMMIEIYGTFAIGASLVFEKQLPDGTWESTSFTFTGLNSIYGTAASPAANATFGYEVDTHACSSFRLRCSAWAAPTGTINVVMTPYVGTTPRVVGAMLMNSLGGTLSTASTGAADTQATGSSGLYTNSYPWLWNGASFDKQRENVNVSVLTSAARTTTQTPADIPTYNARYLELILDMTVITAGPSVTVTINGKDTVSGKYYPLLVGTPITTISTNVLRIGPGLTPSANAVSNDMVPNLIQVIVTANNANAGTYSVGLNLSV